jgi:hypothetical protein
MRYLVFCPCGHSLDSHAQQGCSGDSLGRCGCDLDPGRALEAAIDDVRSRPWAQSEPALPGAET